MPDNNSKLIPAISLKNGGLIKAGNSIQITNKILEEHSQRELATKFKSVIIGEQEWMIENLSVEYFQNGDPIAEARTSSEWISMRWKKIPAWSYLDYDSVNGDKYGKLYNWFAVKDPRGLAPDGWYIPSNKEWLILIDYFGGSTETGLRIRANKGWSYKYDRDTNSSGFSGLPGGWHAVFASFFMGEEFQGYWWSTTKHRKYSDSAWGWGLESYLGKQVMDVGDGLSVRCLKNKGI